MEAATAPGHTLVATRDGDAWFGRVTCSCGWQYTQAAMVEEPSKPWLPQPTIRMAAILEARWEEHRQQDHANEPDPNLVES